MRAPSSPAPRSTELGGTTILVALMMLVFITITAVGLSRNSFREVVTSGTARQGAMAQNVADAGIEYAIFWMDPGNANNAAAPTSAKNLYTLTQNLLMNPGQAGLAWDATDASGATSYTAGAHTAVTLPSVTTNGGTTIAQTYSAAVTRMGKLPITDQSQGVGSGAYTPSQGNVNLLAPDLWAFRIDSQVTIAGVTFNHAKEAWVSTPVSQ
jgi:Tfp pilus assembly protein PilX